MTHTASSPRFPSGRLRFRALRTGLPAAALTASLVAAGLAPAPADDAPMQARGGETLAGAIDPVADVDEVEVMLFAGDRLTAKSVNDRPLRGLQTTLALTGPDGEPAPAKVVKSGTVRPVLTYTAAADGIHRVRVSGRTSGSFGRVGNYRLTLAVKRARSAPQRFAEAAGGEISYRFRATEAAKVAVTATTRKGTLELTGLRGPQAADEPDFAAAVKPARNRRSARVKGYRLTGGAGEYELLGAYTAGAAVKVAVAVDHGERPRLRRLGAEPRFDPIFPPFPSQGVEGTRVFVTGIGFTFVDFETAADVYPRFWFGSVEVPRDTIERRNGGFEMPAPAGLDVGVYDIVVENADGQRASSPGAFTVPSPPSVTGISETEAGPAGGRMIRLTGSNFRSNSLVTFGDKLQQPLIVLSSRIDVRAPAHPPGEVTVTVRDDLGRAAAAPGTFTYLDIGSNRIASVSHTTIQSLGGETVTVTGEDFGAGSVLTIDDADLGATLVSPTEMRFDAPQRDAGQATLRVTDSYAQTSSVTVTYKGMNDGTDTIVPAPHEASAEADGWRATKILTGDVTGDGIADLVLLQAAQAAGGSAGRSRVRVLKGSTVGLFSDVTAASVPGVTGSEDWRAHDGVLADVDADGDLDLAIVTKDDLASGARSGLRILRNDGSGGFQDRTTAWVPAVTTYGDRNQGVVIAAADVDGKNGPDLLVATTRSDVDPGYFTETVSVLVHPGNPDDPSSDPPIYETTTTYHPGLRVLLNDGSGKFARAKGALPAVSPGDVSQYQADTLAVADVDGNGDPDVVLTTDRIAESPTGTFHLTARVLSNSGGTFTDVTGLALPAAADPEYLQGDRVHLADVDGDGDADLLVLSNSVLASPEDGTPSSGPSLRLLVNDGGAFSFAADGTFPAADGGDQLQAADLAVGDLNGDGLPEIVLVSTLAPNSGGRACRILRATGAGWVAGSKAVPNPLGGDDARGRTVVLLDLGQGDGDLDVVLGRDEPTETVRNTRVLVNQRK